MKLPLPATPFRSSACGKVILLGEHAAVHGFPALATGLTQVRLEILLPGLETSRAVPGEAGVSQPLTRWADAWRLELHGQLVELPVAQREKLSASFSKALEVCGFPAPLEEFEPQPVLIRSQIPLGAGMGGSAALSTAFVRLVHALQGKHQTDAALEARLANQIDGLFHGNASGLDVAAIAADGGVIEFIRGRGPAPVQVGRFFWLVLLDSGERAHTVDMVNLVAARLADDGTRARALLVHLGELARAGHAAVRDGRVRDLGQGLNAAHEALRALGVSTSRLDDLVKTLLVQGACGAKLTGAGGGGLVLGLFERDPAPVLDKLRTACSSLYVTQVS